MKEKVVNLMKEKLNITKAVSDYKKLTISDKDNLWSAYKKLAAYLTANHEFTEEEYKEIVRSTIAQSFDASKITSINYTDFINKINSVRIDILDENLDDIQKIINKVKKNERFEGKDFTNGKIK